MDKKNQPISFRLDGPNYKLLEKCSKEVGLTPSMLVKTLVIIGLVQTKKALEDKKHGNVQ